MKNYKNISFKCRKCGNLVYVDQLKSYTLCPYCAHDIISDEEIKCGNCGKKVDSEYLRVCGGHCQYCDAAIWVNDGKNCSSINDDSFWEYPKINQNDEELHSDVSSQNEEKFDWSVRTDSSYNDSTGILVDDEESNSNTSNDTTTIRYPKALVIGSVLAAVFILFGFINAINKDPIVGDYVSTYGSNINKEYLDVKSNGTATVDWHGNTYTYDWRKVSEGEYIFDTGSVEIDVELDGDTIVVNYSNGTEPKSYVKD